jgi:Dolichyl-phosphate-mannose-protein mannosyltransferase
MFQWHAVGSSTSEAQVPNRDSVVPLLTIILIAIGSYWIFTRSNDFPIDYNPDEVHKAYELMSPTSTWDLRQPLLMLDVARLFRDLMHPIGIRETVIVGRTASAAMSALAVTLLSLTALRAQGIFAAILTGITLSLSPPLFIHSHYFKEDTALIFGLAVCLLAAQIVSRRPHGPSGWAAQILLGFGCGLAAGGKLVGAVFVLPSILVTAFASMRPGGNVFLKLGIFAVSAITVFAVINAVQFDTFLPPRISDFAFQQLRLQVARGVHGEDLDVLLRVPNTYCLHVVAAQTSPLVWILLLGPLYAFKSPRAWTLWGVTVVLYTLTAIVTLSCARFPFPRYALPISLLVLFTASVSTPAFVTALRMRIRERYAISVLLTIGIVVVLGRTCVSLDQSLRNDSRQRLQSWILSNISPTASIITDKYACLRDDAEVLSSGGQTAIDRYRVKVAKPYVADVANSFKDFLSEGYDYLVVTDISYRKFFLPEQVPLPIHDDERIRRRKFYASLFENTTPLWTCGDQSYSYTNPEIKVFELPHAREAQTANDLEK